MKFFADYLLVFSIICTILCPQWASCESRPTCQNVSCDPEEACVLRQVTCFRAPCYPIPECVPKTQVPVCSKKCQPQYRCEILEIISKGEYTYTPECIPTGDTSEERDTS
ncbi:uncharacterized protein LOC110837992 [Zootermopsis nevadensis]|uniref:Uncharacterized protein n=1 Tax=Zootermopsis nevadensis TaxID=136037 RepID=A0A067QZB4_ZOONE|nr:uncharacterized protein LOC110837992 [Zootermopsis nevadensis]KDR10412.1 hypothetical protein L798_15424 [Zootermopsis nevadensis]